MAMTISIDDELKEQFSETCKRIGLSPSAAMSVFAKAVVREQRIPFDLRALNEHEQAVYEYEKQVARAIEAGHEDLLHGRVMSREESKRFQQRLRGIEKAS